MSPVLSVKLINVEDSTDVRTLTLSAENPIIAIGRTSPRPDRNLHARSDNALFTSPVISRIHAQLVLADNNLKPTVQIVDLQSMHGTSVDGQRLVAHVPVDLKNGSEIQLGEDVVRHSDKHCAIRVAIQHCTIQPLSVEAVTKATTPNRGFFYNPSISDDGSEDESDDESVKHISSNPTTPENKNIVFNMPGSREQPIDLNEDDEHALEAEVTEITKVMEAETHDEQVDDRNTNDRTAKRDNSISFPAHHSDNEGSEQSENFDDSDGDQFSFPFNTSDAESEDWEGQHPPGFYGYSSDEEDMYDSENMDEFDDHFGDGSDFSHPEDSDDDEGPEVFSSKLPETSTNMPYDPVRGSNPPQIEHAVENQTAPGYMYAHLARPSEPLGTTNLDISSRWDVPPTLEMQYSPFHINEPLQATPEPQAVFSSPKISDDLPAALPLKNKISINDIVENLEQQGTESFDQIHEELMAEAKAIVEPNIVVGKKRKAEEISDNEEPLITVKATDHTQTGPGAESTSAAKSPAVVEPPKKKAKVVLAVAKEAAKYAAASLVGAVAFGAFLVSDYAASLDAPQLS